MIMLCKRCGRNQVDSPFVPCRECRNALVYEMEYNHQIKKRKHRFAFKKSKYSLRGIVLLQGNTDK